VSNKMLSRFQVRFVEKTEYYRQNLCNQNNLREKKVLYILVLIDLGLEKNIPFG
jgi:hypothetical protein